MAIGETTCEKIYLTTQRFPDNEKYGLTNQLRRAGVSISSNIAEGIGRITNTERARYIEIAYSSLLEILNQLILSNDIGFLNEQELLNDRGDIDLLSNKLNAFHRKLLNG